MIRNSFIFLERIGKRGEFNLWNSGIKDWQDFLKKEKITGITREKKEYYNRKIKEAQNFLVEGTTAYFRDKLPKKETWRLYNYFKEECCFLDIEVNSYGIVILVGISDYYNTNIFVKGSNLGKDILEKELRTLINPSF